MDKQREYILQRLSKTHFDTLWKFYRDYFSDDPACLQFILLQCFPKSPRHRRGSSVIIEERGRKDGKLEEKFTERHCNGGCRCIGTPGSLVAQKREGHGL